MTKYNDFYNIQKIYNCLSDELSKQIFITRLKYDMDPNNKNKHDFLSVANPFYLDIVKDVNNAVKNNKKIYLYGAGIYGIQTCKTLNYINNNVCICGIFDRNYEKINPIFNIPILPPPNLDWVARNKSEDYLICITSKDYYNDIKNILTQLNIGKDRILELYSDENIRYMNSQYFQFKKYYKYGAFIDGGCFNGRTSVIFSNWCDNSYSDIYAFEPDIDNIFKCKKNKNFVNLNNLHLINAGIGNSNDKVRFLDGLNASSCISDDGAKFIQIVKIDDIIKDKKVSFIKMDIEGAELDALKGAEYTITRDKPFCAISVYHKPGDILTLAQYLKELVPEYNFILRHYSIDVYETVLYAFV